MSCLGVLAVVPFPPPDGGGLVRSGGSSPGRHPGLTAGPGVLRAQAVCGDPSVLIRRSSLDGVVHFVRRVLATGVAPLGGGR